MEDVFYSICNQKSKLCKLDSFGNNESKELEVQISNHNNSGLVPDSSIKHSNINLIKKCSNMLLKPIKNELSVSFSRLVANMYKDSLKCLRNKKYVFISDAEII